MNIKEKYRTNYIILNDMIRFNIKLKSSRQENKIKYIKIVNILFVTLIIQLYFYNYCVSKI
jgi:hypothetical protein